MLAAWLAFTLPLGHGADVVRPGLAHFGWLSGSAAIHGLKVAAVAVIAQAVWGMGRTRSVRTGSGPAWPAWPR